MEIKKNRVQKTNSFNSYYKRKGLPSGLVPAGGKLQGSRSTFAQGL